LTLSAGSPDGAKIAIVAVLLIPLLGAARQAPPEKAGIQCVITRDGTGEPIAGARVTAAGHGDNATEAGNLPVLSLRPPQSKTFVLTDDIGHFSIPGLVPGRAYRVTAEANGHKVKVVDVDGGRMKAGGPRTLHSASKL
jgi:hypothetical protein